MKSELQQRIDDLTVLLLQLSEAGTLKIEKKTSHGKAESKPPPGVQLDRHGPPDPDDSLLHYFFWRYDKAKSEVGKLALVAEVEIRLRKRLDGKEARAVAGAIGTAAFIGRRDHEKRVAEDYLGLSPAEVAAIESEAYGYCPAAHVRRVRQQDKRNPETGDPIEDDTAKALVLELSSKGSSLRSIAVRTGVAKSTVQDWVRKDKEKGRPKAA